MPETANHIIKHCLEIQKELDYIHENEERREKAIQWLKDNTIGQDFIVDKETQEIIDLVEGDRLSAVLKSPGGLSNNSSEDQDGDFVIVNNGQIRQKERHVKFEGWNKGDFVTNDNIICNQAKVPYVLLNSKNVREIAILNKNFFVKTDQEDSGNFKYRFIDIEGNPIIMILHSDLQVMKVRSIEIPKEYPDKYPSDIDSQIVNFYIRYVCDFAYHHVYCQFLDGVKQITEVILLDSNSGDSDKRNRALSIDCVEMAMINYSYSVGMSIDRWALLNAINNRKNGFTARYCNSTDHSVTICLPYEMPEGSIRKKNKPPRHTFMVHRSGIVTQSGPNIDLMRSAYYRFMSTILQIRHQIIQWDQPFNLKYIPKLSQNQTVKQKLTEDKPKRAEPKYISLNIVNNNIPKNLPIIQIVA